MAAAAAAEGIHTSTETFYLPIAQRSTEDGLKPTRATCTLPRFILLKRFTAATSRPAVHTTPEFFSAYSDDDAVICIHLLIGSNQLRLNYQL